MRVEDLGAPGVDSRAICEEPLGGHRQEDRAQERESNASEAAPVLPDGDEKKRKERGGLRHEARADAPAAPPPVIGRCQAEGAGHREQGREPPPSGRGIPADQHGGERKKEQIGKEEENAAARADEIPGQPLENRMPPYPGLRVHEGVAAKRMAVKRSEPDSDDHDHRACHGTERDAVSPAAQKESEPHASGREQGARAAEERSPHRESRSDHARERSVVRQEKSEGEAEEEDLTRRRGEGLPHAGERGRAECEHGERRNGNVLSVAAPHTGKEKERRGDGHQRGQVLLCLLYTSPSPRDGLLSRMPSSA